MLAPAQLRTMPEDECIVIPKSQWAFKGRKFMSDKHRNRALVKSLPPYYFNETKARDLLKDLRDTVNEMAKKSGNPMPLDKKRQEERDNKNINKAQVANEYINNKDANGVPKVENPSKLGGRGGVMDKAGIVTPADAEEAVSNLIDTTSRLWNTDFSDDSYREIPASESGYTDSSSV